MANIRFYLLEKTTEQQVEYACRLAQKLVSAGQRLYWHHPDTTRLQQLNALLWQFQASSFIPHGIEQQDAAICLSTQLVAAHNVMLFNFANNAVENPKDYAQIIEIVDATEASKALGREKFKYYRRCGIEPKTFKL